MTTGKRITNLWIMGLVAIVGSANAGITSTTDTGGTFTVAPNIALLGTVAHDEPNPIWPGNLNNGTWAYSGTETLHYRHITTVADPSRIWITWAQDYEIDKIGLVHAETALTYVIEDYQIQSLNSGGDPTVDGNWTTIGSVTGNTLIYPEYTIDPVTTRGIRLYITKATHDGGDNLARFEEILVQGISDTPPVGGSVVVKTIELEVIDVIGEKQWQASSDGSSFTNLPGAITATLDVTALYPDTPWFRVEVTNGSYDPAYSETMKVTSQGIAQGTVIIIR